MSLAISAAEELGVVVAAYSYVMNIYIIMFALMVSQCCQASGPWFLSREIQVSF